MPAPPADRKETAVTRPDLRIIRFGLHARRVVLIGSLSMLAVAACSSSDSAGSSSDATVAVSPSPSSDGRTCEVSIAGLAAAIAAQG